MAQSPLHVYALTIPAKAGAQIIILINDFPALIKSIVSDLLTALSPLYTCVCVREEGEFSCPPITIEVTCTNIIQYPTSKWLLHPLLWLSSCYCQPLSSKLKPANCKQTTRLIGWETPYHYIVHTIAELLTI